MPLVYSIFKSLTSGELRYARRFDLDHLSGARIASRTRGAFCNAESTKPDERNASPFFQRVADRIERAIEGFFR